MSKYEPIYAVIIAAVFFFFRANDFEANSNSTFVGDTTITPFIFSPYFPVKDTIYTLAEGYIDVDLKKQKAFLHLRNGDIDSFKISSGNSSLAKGIATPSGVFTIQSKSRLAVSKQFNEAKLINWIGFNGNVGFHGLEGNSYYRTLGVHPSSHGCVRVGREDGDRIFKKTKKGFPVIVFEGEPARAIAFLDSSSLDLNKDYLISKNGEAQAKELSKRLERLYKGYAYVYNDKRLVLDGETVLRSAQIESGNADKIATKQENPILPFYSVPSSRRDILHFSKYVAPIKDSVNYKDEDTLKL